MCAAYNSVSKKKPRQIVEKKVKISSCFELIKFTLL